mgnify:CR=1 FL=1
MPLTGANLLAVLNEIARRRHSRTVPVAEVLFVVGETFLDLGHNLWLGEEFVRTAMDVALGEADCSFEGLFRRHIAFSHSAPLRTQRDRQLIRGRAHPHHHMLFAGLRLKRHCRVHELTNYRRHHGCHILSRLVDGHFHAEQERCAALATNGEMDIMCLSIGRGSRRQPGYARDSDVVGKRFGDECLNFDVCKRLTGSLHLVSHSALQDQLAGVCAAARPV